VTGVRIGRSCHALAVSRSGYYAWAARAPSLKGDPARLADRRDRHHPPGLAGHLRRAARARRSGPRPRHHRRAQHRQPADAQGWPGWPARSRGTRTRRPITITDLVHRDFHRNGPNQLWVTGITEHPTREGKVYCCVVIDVYSRRVVGWAIDSAQRADLATSALGMAIDSRGPAAGGIIHGDHGTQFTSWTFSERARKAGLLPSLGSIGDPYDNAVAESFWGRLQTELLDRQRWNTRIELANAIFEYIEGFHNRRRRHSALGWQAPIDFENATLNRAPTPQIRVQATGS
jgi:putative transposase